MFPSPPPLFHRGLGEQPYKACTAPSPTEQDPAALRWRSSLTNQPRRSRGMRRGLLIKTSLAVLVLISSRGKKKKSVGCGGGGDCLGESITGLRAELARGCRLLVSVTACGAELIYGRARDVAGPIRRAPHRRRPSFPASFPLPVYLLGIWGYGQAHPMAIWAWWQGQAMLKWHWEGCCRAAISYRCRKHPLDAQTPARRRKSPHSSSIVVVLRVPGHPARL